MTQLIAGIEEMQKAKNQTAKKQKKHRKNHGGRCTAQLGLIISAASKFNKCKPNPNKLFK